MNSDKPKGSHLYDVVLKEIEFTCPVRGKVKQMVKVKQYKPIDPNIVEEALTSKNLAEALDRKYSGLFITDDSIVDGS